MSKVAAVSLKDIAERAGVSRISVSLALRGSPKISVATRERITVIAREMGYRPNPFLSALGAHIRSAHRDVLAANLAFVSQLPVRSDARAGDPLHAHEEAFLGARERAEALGFGIEAFHLDAARYSPRRLNQILLSRGIAGIVVHRHFTHAGDWPLEWERFAVCAIGSATDEKRFHSIDADRFTGLQVILDQARARGYRRVGLAMLEDQDIYHRGMQRCVVSGHQLRHQPDACIPHLIVPRFDKEIVGQWIEQYSIDLVVGTMDEVRDIIESTGRRVPDDVGLVRPQVAASCSELAGMRFDYGALGAGAVDVVFSQLMVNIRGMTQMPNHSVIRGVWNEGKTIRPAPFVASSVQVHRSSG